MPEPAASTDLKTLIGRVVVVLTTSDAAEKATKAIAVAQGFRDGTLASAPFLTPPPRPSRPAKPELRLPRDMPRRGTGGMMGRIAMLHALAHIELNAIDLALDMVARFSIDMPRAFSEDWLQVAEEEANHFRMLSDRLVSYDSFYGELPAHDGLWQAAEATADDVLARLAVVPMVLEARGLDVTPTMIDRMTHAGDVDSAECLRLIYRDEIGHVSIGRRWFDYVAERRGLDPMTAWHDMVRSRFRGTLKRPFNEAGRKLANLPPHFYEPLADTKL